MKRRHLFGKNISVDIHYVLLDRIMLSAEDDVAEETIIQLW